MLSLKWQKVQINVNGCAALWMLNHGGKYARMKQEGGDKDKG